MGSFLGLLGPFLGACLGSRAGVIKKGFEEKVTGLRDMFWYQASCVVVHGICLGTRRASTYTGYVKVPGELVVHGICLGTKRASTYTGYVKVPGEPVRARDMFRYQKS